MYAYRNSRRILSISPRYAERESEMTHYYEIYGKSSCCGEKIEIKDDQKGQGHYYCVKCGEICIVRDITMPNQGGAEG